MPAAGDQDRSQAGHLDPEDCRPGNEPRQALPPRPGTSPEPSISMAELEAIADRLSEQIPAGVPGSGCRDHSEAAHPAGQGSRHVRLMNLGPVQDRQAATNCEVVPRQPSGRPGTTVILGQERGILAEENTPIVRGRGVTHRSLDRPRCSLDPQVGERRDPRPGPAVGEAARVLGEGNHRCRRPVETQPAQPRDTRAGRGDYPGYSPERHDPAQGQRSRNAVPGRRDDDLAPVRSRLERQISKGCPNRHGRVADRDHDAQFRLRPRSATLDGSIHPTRPSPGSSRARTSSRSSRRTPRP
jgi:hypothetical protein